MSEAGTASFVERFPSTVTHSKWQIQLDSESAVTSDDEQESVLSLQDKETDIAKDTSDTDTYGSDYDSSGAEASAALAGVEYDVVSEVDSDMPLESRYEDSSGGSDNIITTEVISLVVDDLDKGYADSEESSFGSSDSEINPSDYWKCINCHNRNNNPMFRFCEKCFKVRKNYFPPRPKGKNRKLKRTRDEHGESAVHDSGPPPSKRLALSQSSDYPISSQESAGSSSNAVVPVVKSISDPEICFDSNGNNFSQTSDYSSGSSLPDSQDLPKINLKGSEDSQLCITCTVEPKTGVFVHSRTAHICCCYKCARKVWELTKRCPICNCKVSKVLKAFVF